MMIHTTTPPRFQSYHHVNGYKSAILDLYRQSKVKPNDNIDDMLMETMAGYKRLVAELKQNGEIEIDNAGQLSG
jgi:hypothetical protein